MRFRLTAAVVVGVASLAALGASLASAQSPPAPTADGRTGNAPPPTSAPPSYSTSQPDAPASWAPVLPTTPISSPPVLGDTTTPDIGAFTHPGHDIWTTPRGETLTLAGYLNDLGIARFASTYGGLAVSDGGLTIYLTTPNAATESAFRAVTPDATLTFIATPHTWQFLLALQQVVLHYWTSLRASGTDVIGFGPTIRTGTLQIRVGNPTPEGTAVLGSMFGASNITVVRGFAPQFSTAAS
jgi:hypothetical protein